MSCKNLQISWDLLAKEKTSEAKTTCKKLRCFLPMDAPSWDRRVVPGSVWAPGSALRGNAAYSFQVPGSNSAQLPSARTSCLGKTKGQGSLSHSFMRSTNMHFDSRHLGDVVYRATALCSSPLQTYNATVLPSSTVPGGIWHKYLLLCSASFVQD